MSAKIEGPAKAKLGYTYILFDDRTKTLQPEQSSASDLIDEQTLPGKEGLGKTLCLVLVTDR